MRVVPLPMGLLACIVVCRVPLLLVGSVDPVLPIVEGPLRHIPRPHVASSAPHLAPL